MNVHNVVGTGSYTTSTTNMYNKDQFHVPVMRATDFFQRDVTLPGLIAAVWQTGWHQCT